MGGTGGSALTQLSVGNRILVNNEIRKVASITNNNQFTINSAITLSSATNQTIYKFGGGAGVAYFWYTPRPNVSQDGRYVLFTSNMEGTLGATVQGEAGGEFRTDVFLIELPIIKPSAPSITVFPAATNNCGAGCYTITWTTSTNTDSRVDYGATTSYGSTGAGQLTRNGTQTIIGTNTSFTTQLQLGSWITINGAKYQVTKITDGSHINVLPVPNVSDTTGQPFTINNVRQNYKQATSHSVQVTGVSPGWHYKVASRDRSGQIVTSVNLTFP